MNKLRVAISKDVLSAEGVPIYDPSVLSLLDHPRIEWSYMPGPLSELSPDFAAHHDVFCAMVERVTAATLGRADQRLRLVARFGVGYDAIDVPACSASGVMLSIAPDGVRRPVARSSWRSCITGGMRMLFRAVFPCLRAVTRRWCAMARHRGR